MTKFKVLLTRAERAFIFFSIQSFNASRLNTPEFEGLRVCYLATLFKLYRRGFDLFRIDDLDYSFSISEIGAVYQMTNEIFCTLTSTEAITAARGIIWKMHPILMRNQHNFKLD